jgi:putative inorganic carbon (hco3(-)) transporter
MAERLTPVNWGLGAAVVGLSVIVGLLAGFDPKFAIAASIGIAFMLIVFVDLTVGLAAFGTFSFLEILQLGSTVSVGKLLGVILALGWFAYIVTREDARADFFATYPAISLFLGLFLGWVLLSATWAESAPAVIGAFGRYLPNVVLFVIVFTAVSRLKDATTVITGLLIGAMAAALYGLAFAPAPITTHYDGRLTGTNLDPNELASVLVPGIALALGLAVSMKRKPGAQLAAVGVAVFCLLTALYTGSRGGVVALGAMLVAAILFSGRWRGRVVVVSALVATFTVFYIIALAPTEIRQRIESSSQGENQALEPRTTLWEIGERMIRANPVTGVGAGNFSRSARHYVLQPGALFRTDVVIFNPSVTHNTYIQIGAELGLVGLGLFIAIVGFSLAAALQAAKNFRSRGDPGGEVLARCLAIGLVGILVADTFISQMYNKQLWLLLGLGPAMLAISRRREVGPAQDAPEPRLAAKSSS